MKEKYKVVLEKNWIWSVLAFGIPFVVSVVICAAHGIYPFGENCILHIDMYHQYCPFFMEFRDKLANGGSLFYSWNVGLGADFIALYAYYLASPLNWLLVLCPKSLVIEFMTFTTWIKISGAGLFFFWFLAEKFSLKKSDGKYRLCTVMPALIFSTAYAFSGFVATYSWNIMWMDSIALAPLIVMGLVRLINKNDPRIYYVSLAVSILSNYYISIMICIFLVLYFLVLLLEQKKGKLMACVRFAWYSLLAGGTAAILLIPEIIMLGYTASADSSFPETMTWYFGFVEEFSRLCTTAAPYNGVSHWPNLYCGAFTVLLVLLYVLNEKISWKRKLPNVILLVFFFVSFANNYLSFIWHGFHFPNSLPARHSFLCILLMLTLGYEAYRKRKGNKIWHVVAAVVVCIVLLVLGSKKMEAEIVESSAFWLTGIFMVAYMLCFILHKIGSKQMKMIVKGFTFGLAMGEVLLNMGVTGFYSLNRAAYLQKMEDYEVLFDIAKADSILDAEEGKVVFYSAEEGNAVFYSAEQGDVFYRIEDTERKTKNDASLYGYRSGTLFSSLTNASVTDFYKKVYMEGAKNSYSYNGATPIISSMLSVKYMLSDNAEGENVLREIRGSSGGYYLYENKYCLPLGFMMSEEAISNWDINTGEKIETINSLGHVLGANGDILVPVNAAMIVNEGITTITVPDDGMYFGYYNKCDADNLTISINDGAGTRYNKTTHRYLFEFGQCMAGDEIVITNSKNSLVSFELYRLSTTMVDLAYNTLNQQTMVMEEFDDTYIKGHIDVSEPGRLIFSIPSEEGWKIYVDGKERESLDFKETFLGVYLEKGTHTIELKYVTPGIKMGAIISSVCVGLFVLTMRMRKRRVSE